MTVIYIMAASHSGSTLLSFLLGSHPQIFNLGELKEFENFFNPLKEDDRGQYNTPCDCGIRVYDCPFWSKINDKTPLSKTKANDIILYQAIRTTAQEPILVDNSKNAERFKFYPKHNIPYKIVHLIRDGRAKGFSDYKLKRDIKKSMKKWALMNKFISNKYRDDPNYMLVHYEDLTTEPVKTLNKILGMVNLETTADQLNYHDKEFHSIGGNRKVRTNRSEIKFDDDYLNRMTTEQWHLAEKTIGDTLRYFGYDKGQNENN